MSSEKTLGHVFGLDPEPRTFVPHEELIVGDVLLGVEVELESVMFPGHRLVDALSMWRVDRDHSLRGPHAFEFKFRLPYAGHDAVAAIGQLEDCLRKADNVPLCSERTSLHVHMDMRSAGHGTTSRLLLLNILMEPLLSAYCGEKRKSNIFCLGVDSAAGQLSVLSSLYRALVARAEPKIHAAIGASSKYCAHNWASVGCFGTVEYRQHGGEWRKSNILRWINIILSMRKYAEESTHEGEVLPTLVSGGSYSSFVREVFGDDLAELLLYDGAEQDLIRSARFAQDIANANALQFSAQAAIPVCSDIEESFYLKVTKGA